MLREENTPDEPQSSVEVHDLAERLARAKSDDEFEEVVRHIAERTGTGQETLQQALTALRKQSKQKQTWWGRFRGQIEQMGEATKRTIISGFLGLQAGLIAVLGIKFSDEYGIGQIAQVALIALAVWNIALSKRKELAMLVGGVLGVAYMVGRAVSSAALQTGEAFNGLYIIPVTIAAGLVGYLIGMFSNRILSLRFQHDPEKRREYLLKQLIELQDELKVGERMVTFMSVDVVGSTRIKADTDALASEYTFGEYTKYVAEVAKHFGGSIHSTAGDGVMLTFENPHQAFLAARRLQAGMIEFNAFKNRTREDFSIRCGIHAGTVVAPAGGDIRSVNYSHVIDVSAHTEKVAPPGGIAVTDAAAMYVPGGPDAISEQRKEVAGLTAVIWEGHTTKSEERSPADAPPPLPSFDA